MRRKQYGAVEGIHTVPKPAGKGADELLELPLSYFRFQGSGITTGSTYIDKLLVAQTSPGSE